MSVINLGEQITQSRFAVGLNHIVHYISIRDFMVIHETEREASCHQMCHSAVPPRSTLNETKQNLPIQFPLRFPGARPYTVRLH